MGGVAYFHEAGVDVVEVEEERDLLYRKLLTRGHAGKLGVRLVVANGYEGVEEDAVCPWNGDTTNDVVSTGNLVLVHRLLQLSLFLR